MLKVIDDPFVEYVDRCMYVHAHKKYKFKYNVNEQHNNEEDTEKMMKYQISINSQYYAINSTPRRENGKIGDFFFVWLATELFALVSMFMIMRPKIFMNNFLIGCYRSGN